MAKAILDVVDQRRIAAGQVEDRLDHLDVRQLLRPADVVDLARLALGEDHVDRRGEVLGEEPVADLHPVAVNG